MNAGEFYLEDLKSKFSKINPNEYYLAYSGGRDSHFILWFIKEYLHEKRIPVVYNNTGMDLPEIAERALANADYLLKIDKHPFEIKEKYGIPLNSKASDQNVYEYQKRKEKGISDDDMPNWVKYYALRQADALEGRRDGKLPYSAVNIKTRDAMVAGTLHKVSPLCCKYMKKEPARKYQMITGRKPIIAIMGAESWSRKTNIRSCFNKNGNFYPIWDLEPELQAEIEKEFDIPVPKVYEHLIQTGCVCCPYGLKNAKGYFNGNYELNLIPEGRRKFFLEYFKESYEFKDFFFVKNFEYEED